MDMVTVNIDDNQQPERAIRNNRSYWLKAKTFVEDAMRRAKIYGQVNLRPRCHVANGKSLAVTLSRPVKLIYQPGGIGTCWEYEVCPRNGISNNEIHLAIHDEIEFQEKQKVSPVVPVTLTPTSSAVVTCSTGVTIPAAPAAPVAASLSPDAMALLSGIMVSAVKVEEWRKDVIEKRRSLALLRHEQVRVNESVKSLEDEIAGIELQIEGDPEARKASAFLDAMASLIKSRQ